MRTLATLALTALAALTMLVSPAGADTPTGAPAPRFQARDATGRTVTLARFKGRYTVLEWWNHECPFVVAQYKPGRMQDLQKRWRARGVAWVTICSSAPGRQGSLSPQQAHAVMQRQGGQPDHLILDRTGVLGRRYGAKTTPHMFVINPEGILIYQGAIDDRGQLNYVEAALSEAMAGQEVSHPATTPYGCSVKYETAPQD